MGVQHYSLTTYANTQGITYLHTYIRPYSFIHHQPLTNHFVNMPETLTITTVVVHMRKYQIFNVL